jgi:DNA polymerase-3 subunit epsilon
MFTAYDTETTGKILWNDPSEDTRQPRICSIAWLDYNDAGKVVAERYRLIKPDGWLCPAEATDIHGLTNEKLMDEGLPIADVLDEFFETTRDVDPLVAFNKAFDVRMVRIEMMRIEHYATEAQLAAWKESDRHQCSMWPMKSRCKLPPTPAMRKKGMFKFFKQPDLSEAYSHAFGRPHEGAHGALADAKAAGELWIWLLANGYVPTKRKPPAQRSLLAG